MTTVNDISSASHSYSDLHKIKNDLIIRKMKMDKFFSIFLDSVELEDESLDSDGWITYKEMLKDYEQIGHLIRTTDYYIGQYERLTSISNV